MNGENEVRTKFLSGNVTWRVHLGELGVGMRILLKWILEK